MNRIISIAALLALVFTACSPVRDFELQAGESVSMKGSYTDFKLTGQALLTDGADASVYFHTDAGLAKGYQVLFHNGPSDGSRKSGSLASVRNLYRSMAEDGTWFPFEIAVRDKNIAVRINGTDVVFSLLGGYPCCTCNWHQGWPKLVQNLFYASRDGGLAALVYAPSSVSATLDGKEVVLTEDTAYPFDGSVRFRIHFPGKHRRRAMPTATFPLHLRIPAWCDSATVTTPEGECHPAAGETLRLERCWHEGDEVTLHLPMKVSYSLWYDNAAVVERGPLLYALKMNETWTRKSFEGKEAAKFGPWYYEVTSDSPWNYGFLFSELTKPETFSVEEKAWSEAYPWNVENAPVTIRARAVTIRDWTENRGSAAPINYFSQSRADVGEKAEIELIPYGCTTLRICAFPTRW